jgi:hypothetical protein
LGIYITGRFIDKNILLKKHFVGVCYSLIIGNEAVYKSHRKTLYESIRETLIIVNSLDRW